MVTIAGDLANVFPVQMECPNVRPMQSPVTGEALWDSISLERSLESLATPVRCSLVFFMKFSMLDLSCDIVQSLRQGIALYANETVAVPVCNVLQAVGIQASACSNILSVNIRRLAVR